MQERCSAFKYFDIRTRYPSDVDPSTLTLQNYLNLQTDCLYIQNTCKDYCDFVSSELAFAFGISATLLALGRIISYNGPVTMNFL